MQRPSGFFLAQWIVCLSLLPAGAEERQPSWLATYDGPGSNARGVGTRIARDPLGNLYVAGHITWARWYESFILLKYDPFGQELWRALYDSPSAGPEQEVRGLVVDGAGNAYVACTSYGGDQTGDDIATLKYSASGEQLWARRYDGGFHWGRERTAGVAVDSAGNVYVAGSGEGDQGEFDFVTLKYTAQGDLSWVRREDGLEATGVGSHGRDGAAGIVLDGNENAVVTGRSEPGDGTASGVVTLAYDPEGNILWASRDLGPGGEAASVSAMVISAAGDIFLAGDIQAASGDRAYLTMRKDSSGKTLWRRVYDGDTDGQALDARASSIAFDPNGNVVVTGNCRLPEEPWECATVEYSLDGTRLWAARYGAGLEGHQNANTVGVDGAGNVYVSGDSSIPDSKEDWLLLRYDNSGHLIESFQLEGGYTPEPRHSCGAMLVHSWTEVYATGYIRTDKSKEEIVTVRLVAAHSEVWRALAEGKGYEDDACTAMTMDGAGNVIVTGRSMCVGGIFAYATVKYDSSGREAWAVRSGHPDGDNYANAIAADADGSVVVTGEWNSSGQNFDDRSSQLGTVKYDRSGNELWRAVRPVGEYAMAPRIAIDGQGNIWIAGVAVHRSWVEDDDSWAYWDVLLVIKYDRDGNELWSVEPDLPDGPDNVVGLAIGGAGDAHVAMRTGGGDFRTWLLKLDSGGEVQWLVPGVEEDFRANALVCDGDGAVYLTGPTQPSLDEPGDYVTVKYGADGASLWTARYVGPAGGHDEALALALDASGSIVVTGKSAGEGTGLDFATVKYNPDGSESWVARYQGPGASNDVARALALDGAGNVIVAGSSIDPAYVGRQIVAAYSPAGHEMWTGALDGHRVEDAWCGIAVGPDGEIYVGGTVDSDLSVTKYAGPVESILPLTLGPAPNPAVVGDKAILFAGSLPAIDRESILHAALFRNVAAGDASRLLEEVALYIDDGDGIFDEGKDRKVGLGAFGGDQRLDLTGMDAAWPSGTLLTIFLVGQIPSGEKAVGCAAPRSGPAGSRGGVLAACSGVAVFLLLLAGMAGGRRRSPIRRLAAAAASCSIAIAVCLALSCDGGGGGGHGEPASQEEIQVQLDELSVDGVAADGLPALASWKVSL